MKVKITQKLMIDHFYNNEDQLVRKMTWGVIELISVLPNGIIRSHVIRFMIIS